MEGSQEEIFSYVSTLSTSDHLLNSHSMKQEVPY